ncbi:MAG: hypothetical protein K6G62_07315, partial [Eubacterium sp.]|nr:hypothetical protein [Eubacterium sp.]
TPSPSLTTQAQAASLVNAQETQASEVQMTGKAKYKKDENIYGILAATGQLEQMYVVNQFEVTKAGQITDLGNYDEIANLTDTSTLETQGKRISFSANKGNFYYQGSKQNADLPWTFQIKYYLDGREVDAGSLAGAKGDLKLRIKSQKTKGVDPVFYDNFMLQISLTLDNEKASRVQSPDATVADAGSSRQFNYTVMPGEDADILLAAKVEDFEMDGISIAAIPFNMTMDLPDSDGMVKGMNKLSDGVSDLDDGVGEFKDGLGEYVAGVELFDQGIGQINQNMSKLTKGGTSLQKGSSQIDQGLEKIAGGGAGLQQGSAQIGQTLNSLAASLETMDLSGLNPKDAAIIKQTIGGLSKNYSTFDQGLKEYTGGVSTLSKNYGNFHKGLKEYTNGVGKLGKGFKEVASGSHKLASNGSKLTDGMSELKKGTGKLSDSVAKMPEKTQEKIDDMMSDYVKEFDMVSFVDSSNKKINAVQFTLTTPEIKIPEVQEEVEEETEENLLDRFVSLFKK